MYKLFLQQLYYLILPQPNYDLVTLIHTFKNISKTILFLFLFAVPDDKDSRNALWGSGFRPSRWHGWEWRRKYGRVRGWQRFRWLHFRFRSRCQTPPMSTVFENLFIQSPVGPAHTGAHGGKTVQMFIL